MKRGNITLNNPQRFEEHFEISKEKLSAAINHPNHEMNLVFAYSLVEEIMR